MPKDTLDTLRATAEAAGVAWENHRRTAGAFTTDFNPSLAAAELAAIDARAALADAEAAHNASAKDTAGVIAFVVAELEHARDAYAAFELEQPGVPPLSSVTPAALAAHTTARLARAGGAKERGERLAEISGRLGAALRTAVDGAELVRQARKASNQPPPPRVIPAGVVIAAGVQVPRSAAECTQLIAKIEAGAPGKSWSHDALRGAELRKQLDAYNAEREESARVAGLSPNERHAERIYGRARAAE